MQSPAIRIAFCITELEAGGAERCLAELAARIDRTRFAPSVYCLAPHPGQRPNVVHVLEAAGVSVHYLRVTRFWQVPRAIRELSRLWRNKRPQIVQSFLIHANLVSRFAARRAGVPHLVNGVRVAERRPGWLPRLDRWTANACERHVCVSESVAAFTQQALGVPRERLVVIPNGLDLAAFDQAALAGGDFPLRRDRRHLLYVGRLDPQKNVEWLVEQAPQWLAELPGHDLVLVGDGPLRAKLEQRIRQLGLDGRVICLGWRSDVPSLLKASELLLLPSSWEGMPNAVLEAMAARKAVVASDVEGVRELLGDRADEQIAPRQDASQFRQRLVHFANNEPLRAELGQQNRARVEQQFTIDCAVKSYEQLYLSLL